ncbi:natural resistance-associated macrophage protein [Lophium mytilinum]|uniref:Natural resistance-associated macrophage protein n=1 Tax=Lophium mytilinum TaxID=390894 RepID=A0A6A6QR03_9PEZI|nr:natural resistance-associated macrophage protein [Lophium mytilinum]
MNCPSRVDPAHMDGWNQNPDSLNADATTRADLGQLANARLRRDHLEMGEVQQLQIEEVGQDNNNERDNNGCEQGKGAGGARVTEKGTLAAAGEGGGDAGGRDGVAEKSRTPAMRRFGKKAWHIGSKYLSFIGPGMMVAVAYIDPGNYATDVAAGASYRFKLLFIILMSNIFAIFLQSLCIKLGSVTGMNLAENCKAHLPPWLNIALYVFAESAIIATDIAEVIGTAIALNVLLKVPLVAGCAISIVDVLIILFFYRPSGSIRALRAFEFFVMALVLGVVICFCFQLSLIENTPVGEVFRGYLPSSAIVESQGLYQSCGILGATVMPHSLYLGSGIVQARLREFDKSEGNISDSETSRQSHDATGDDRDTDFAKYRPSLAAIRSCMTYSIVELAVSLFTFALFVNSAILIVAGASLYNVEGSDSADLFTIHDLLSSSLAPTAGTIFALALLLSGTSAGIVCTIAGQMVSEGQLNWTVKPWVRRLMTRSISITPSIIIAGAVGRHGLSRALEGSQVALSVILPFTSAPLIWFTCRSQYMKVSVGAGGVDEGNGEDAERDSPRDVQMRNHWITASFAVVIWTVIVVMNIALLVLVGKGVA